MEYTALPVEWASEPKTEELAQKILTHLANAKVKNDLVSWRQATLLLVETYLAIDQPEEAADLIRGTLEQNVFEDFKTILDLSDKLVQILVKNEDFEQLAIALDFRDRFVDQSPTQKVMQQFYRAVCFEGLKKYDQAIDTLNAIPDNMSNAKLVSKYLKLAMLNLQVRDYPNSLLALRRAEVFDKNHSNEMFGIVESDLAFYSGDYESALAKFEAFFIKSAFKNRYLDRYIRINVKLGRYDDAWRFFQKYESKMAKNASRFYRYQFYDAAIQLADAMNNREIALIIKEKMLGLYESKARFIDQFDGVKKLLDQASKRVVYASEREVVLDIFRQLTAIVSFGRLQYIEATPDGIRVGNYTKGLMIDKNFSKQAIVGTILSHIVDDSAEFALYRDNELAKVTDYLDFKPFPDTGFVSVQTFTVGVKPTFFGKIAAYLEQDAQFDYYNKLLSVARDLLSIKLEYHRLHTEKGRLIRMMSDYFSRQQIGIAKIADGFLYFENPEAMQMLGLNRDVIPFETFQASLVSTKPLYLDDFAVKSHLEVVYRRNEREVTIAMDSFVSEHIIRLFMTDITSTANQSKSMRELTESSKYPGISSYARFMADYSANRVALTLILMKLSPNDSDSPILTSERAKRVLTGLSDVLIRFGNKHVTAIYAAEEFEWLIGFDTTDRRAIERLAKDTAEAMNLAYRSISGDGTSLSVRFASNSSDTTQKVESFLSELEFAISMTNDANLYIAFDRSTSIRFQLLKTIGDVVSTQLGKTNVLLQYRPFGRISSRKIAFYLAEVLDPFGHSKDSVEAAVQMANLVSVFDQERLKTLFIDVIRYNEVKHSPAFALILESNYLFDVDLEKRLASLIKRFKQSVSSIILLFRANQATGNDTWNHAISMIRSKGFQVGLVAESNRTLSQCATFAQYDFIFAETLNVAQFLQPYHLKNLVIDQFPKTSVHDETYVDAIVGGDLTTTPKSIDDLLTISLSTAE